MPIAKLKPGKPIVREIEVAPLVSRKPLIFTFAVEGVSVRVKGASMTYGPLPWGHLYMEGARMRAAEIQLERAQRKMQKRAGLR